MAIVIFWFWFRGIDKPGFPDEDIVHCWKRSSVISFEWYDKVLPAQWC
jgi:hypothetical protein